MKHSNIFVNLPVRDLEKSKDFFGELGYSFNPQFCDETAACMILGDNLFAMLLTHAKFQEFNPREICDSSKATEVLTCLACASRGEVDDLVKKAVAAGGRTYNESKDYGFMYSHAYQDIDGHIWELMWMDPSAIQ